MLSGRWKTGTPVAKGAQSSAPTGRRARTRGQAAAPARTAQASGTAPFHAFHAPPGARRSACKPCPRPQPASSTRAAGSRQHGGQLRKRRSARPAWGTAGRRDQALQRVGQQAAGPAAAATARAVPPPRPAAARRPAESPCASSARRMALAQASAQADAQRRGARGRRARATRPRPAPRRAANSPRRPAPSGQQGRQRPGPARGRGRPAAGSWESTVASVRRPVQPAPEPRRTTCGPNHSARNKGPRLCGKPATKKKPAAL